MSINQELPNGKRAALYIDGFNLYHPIHDKGESHLKWANLWMLGEIFCRPNALNLVKVVFCTTRTELPSVQKALAAGADEYIMKPFDGEALQSKLLQVGLL